jgi:hypothetical protein
MGYKIIVPKSGAANLDETVTKTYAADEQVDAKESWQKDLMEKFVQNGWAVEVKMQSTNDLDTGSPTKAPKATKEAPKKRTKKKN